MSCNSGATPAPVTAPAAPPIAAPLPMFPKAVVPPFNNAFEPNPYMPAGVVKPPAISNPVLIYGFSF